MAKRDQPEGRLAIDPGLSGALALLVGGEFRVVADMPCEKKRSGKRQVDAIALYDLLCGWQQAHAPRMRCLIEQVSAMPGQGVSGMFSLGDSFGVARAIAHTVCYEVAYITPGVWKGAMSLTRDKEYSRTLARRRFPQAREYLELKKHEGRAEALLLALYSHTRMSW